MSMLALFGKFDRFENFDSHSANFGNIWQKTPIVTLGCTAFKYNAWVSFLQPIDIEVKDYQYFKSACDSIRALSPNAKCFVLVHKLDLVPNPTRQRVYKVLAYKASLKLQP